MLTFFGLCICSVLEVLDFHSHLQVPSPGLPLVCEISLKTAEGDQLVLELWRLAVIAGGDPSVKVSQVNHELRYKYKALHLCSLLMTI